MLKAVSHTGEVGEFSGVNDGIILNLEGDTLIAVRNGDTYKTVISPSDVKTDILKPHLNTLIEIMSKNSSNYIVTDTVKGIAISFTISLGTSKEEVKLLLDKVIEKTYDQKTIDTLKKTIMEQDGIIKELKKSIGKKVILQRNTNMDEDYEFFNSFNKNNATIDSGKKYTDLQSSDLYIPIYDTIEPKDRGTDHIDHAVFDRQVLILELYSEYIRIHGYCSSPSIDISMYYKHKTPFVVRNKAQIRTSRYEYIVFNTMYINNGILTSLESNPGGDKFSVGKSPKCIGMVDVIIYY